MILVNIFYLAPQVQVEAVSNVQARLKVSSSPALIYLSVSLGA